MVMTMGEGSIVVGGDVGVMMIVVVVVVMVVVVVVVSSSICSSTICPACSIVDNVMLLLFVDVGDSCFSANCC